MLLSLERAGAQNVSFLRKGILNSQSSSLSGGKPQGKSIFCRKRLKSINIRLVIYKIIIQTRIEVKELFDTHRHTPSRIENDM